MDDDELVERIEQGDQDAAEALVRRYYGAILRYCRSRCGGGARAEDLTQETFLRLFTALPGYKRKKRFRAFLYTIAEHLCTDESRKVRSYPLEEEMADERDMLRQTEDRAEAEALLGTLPAEQRTAFVCRYYYSDPISAIAKNIGASSPKVKSMLFRLRAGLKAFLEKEEIL